MDVFKVFSVTILGFLLCFDGIECGAIAGCYSDYQQCYNTYSQVPRPQDPSADWTSFCNAADTLDTCLKNDVTTCGSSDTEPESYRLYAATAADSKKSCKVVECTNSQMKCSLEYANATSLLTSGVTPEGLARLCEVLPATKTCFNNFVKECSVLNMTEGIDQTLQGIDQQIVSCQSQGSGKCLAKSLECVNITMEIMPNMNFDINDPQGMMQQIGAMCPVMSRLKECYNGLVAECPTFVNSSDDALKNFQMIEQFCGSGTVNCLTKFQECALPLAAYPNCTDPQIVDNLSLSEGVNCCKLGTAATKCLRDAGCGNILSSYPTLQRSDTVCRGYNDYCPDMFDCFEATYPTGGFNDPTAVCRNVGGLLTCIEEKCANKPQIGQQTLAKIKEVFTNICGVVVKYPAVASCQTFTDCIDNTPSLPGIVPSIHSFISARDSDRWCQIAKSYASCGQTAAEGNSCNQGTSFTTDVSTTKMATDQACTGVRGPCVKVSDCLATLMGSQTQMMFRTTCPNIPSFVNCTDNALTTCGDESRVKADYSLVDVKDLYVETCAAMTDELYQCGAITPCLDLQLPSNTGDMIIELSDQTSWCRKLNHMLKCTADASTACQQPKAVHDKFMMMYHKVSKLCPSPGYQAPMEGTTPPPTVDDNNAAGAIRVTGVVVITVFMMIFY